MHNHKEGWNFFAVKQLDLSVKVRTPFKNKEGFDLYFACRIKISGFMFVCLVIVLWNLNKHSSIVDIMNYKLYFPLH